jgi:hypothetical protein
MRILRTFILLSAATGVVALAIACGGDDGDDVGSSSGSSGGVDSGPRGVEQTGQECKVPSDCYDGVDGGAEGGLKGEVICLDKVPNGYCTHLCTKDEDCCAVPGECKTGLTQVCGPFTSTNQDQCFLSCEDADIDKAIAAQSADGGFDGSIPDSGADGGSSRENEYCKAYASAAFTCRSTGGGKTNRKVCLP